MTLANDPAENKLTTPITSNKMPTTSSKHSMTKDKSQAQETPDFCACVAVAGIVF
jgi:hypothetical protein